MGIMVLGGFSLLNEQSRMLVVSRRFGFQPALFQRGLFAARNRLDSDLIQAPIRMRVSRLLVWCHKWVFFAFPVVVQRIGAASEQKFIAF